MLNDAFRIVCTCRRISCCSVSAASSVTIYKLHKYLSIYHLKVHLHIKLSEDNTTRQCADVNWKQIVCNQNWISLQLTTKTLGHGNNNKRHLHLLLINFAHRGLCCQDARGHEKLQSTEHTLRQLLHADRVAKRFVQLEAEALKTRAENSEFVHPEQEQMISVCVVALDYM